MDEVKAIVEDRGFKSRKFIAYVVAAVLITVGLVLCGLWTGLATLYTSYVSGITGTLLIYLGGNITGKWSSLKALPDKIAGKKKK